MYHAAAALLSFALLASSPAAAQSKNFLVVLAHHDDHTWEWGFAGMIAKLAEEGASGYYVRTTNDEKDASAAMGWGKGDQVNLAECRIATRALGMKDVISLNWRNDHTSSVPLKEMRAQFILLIRKFRPAVVMTFDPWGHYDRNPDHRKVARAMGEALWLAQFENVNPEHLDLGLKPYRVPQVYYGQRDDYGLGHTPNFKLTLTPAQVEKKRQAWWAHKNVRGNPASQPAPGNPPNQEVYFSRGEWDDLPGLKEILP